jgi:hypothetical protein
MARDLRQRQLCAVEEERSSEGKKDGPCLL